MTRLPIYMDHHATTPVDPSVLEAMLPYFRDNFGNAGSRSHVYGWRAEEAVENARSQVARLIGSTPKEIIWTSGATESDNLALKGAARFHEKKGRHLVTCTTEHKAVLDPLTVLEKEGFEVTRLEVGRDGRVDPDVVRAALRPDTTVVSIMLANNEIGAIQPVEAIGRITREAGVLFHCDAVQGVGRIPFDVEGCHADLLSLSAHKMYGPKGVGALYVRRQPRARLEALFHGGGQERALRPGTLNVPGIVGFGQAAAVAQELLPTEAPRLLGLRERLREALMAGLDEIHLNGGLEHRLPGNLNVSFGGVEGEALLLSMKDVAVSAGSACTSSALEPSHVLKAIGVSNALAHSSLRFGLGRGNTEEEVDRVAVLVIAQVKRLRAMAP